MDNTKQWHALFLIQKVSDAIVEYNEYAEKNWYEKMTFNSVASATISVW